MEETAHLINTLKDTQKALKTNNSAQLQALSNQTIHSASIHQHTDYVIIAVIIYSLSKLIYRKNGVSIKNWDAFVKKINAQLTLAIKALQEHKQDKFLQYIEQTRKTLTGISPNLKQYIQDVLRKASINKASKIYEHGISLGQTAKLLGITGWELAEYVGQKGIPEAKHNLTRDIRQRARMAVEFFG